MFGVIINVGKLFILSAALSIALRFGCEAKSKKFLHTFYLLEDQLSVSTIFQLFNLLKLSSFFHKKKQFATTANKKNVLNARTMRVRSSNLKKSGQKKLALNFVSVYCGWHVIRLETLFSSTPWCSKTYF